MGGSSTKNLDYSERNGDGSTNGGELNQDAQVDPVCTLCPSIPSLRGLSIQKHLY